jgi:hypothetical protein
VSPSGGGLNLSGRWVRLGYDDQIITGFAFMGAHRKTEKILPTCRLVIERTTQIPPARRGSTAR